MILLFQNLVQARFFFIAPFMGLILFSSCSEQTSKEKGKLDFPGNHKAIFNNLSDTRKAENANIQDYLLDSTERVLFAPLIFKADSAIASLDYFIHWQQVALMAKQEKVGDFLPVIISVTGDDYGSLFYVLLNEENKPVSCIQISGGLCAGPEEVQDSLLRMCAVKHSFLKAKEITTYRLFTLFHPDSVKHPVIIDSISYISTIMPSGVIQTTKRDSVRYESSRQ